MTKSLLASILVVALTGCPLPSVTNRWSGATVDPTHLPLGDAWVSRAGPSSGHLFQCDTGTPAAPVGAENAGPWIDLAHGVWDLDQKLSVGGRVSWPAAEYGESVSAGVRTLATNGLPVHTVTGSFPILPGDPAYRYDRNLDSIVAVALRYRLPLVVSAAASPVCLPLGPIALLRNGVALFAAVDQRGRDAVAWETQDTCQGHPQQQGQYHYHDVSACLRDASPGASTVVGWAADGYPIVVERDGEGRLPTNADLDPCHGRSSEILLDGLVVDQYHYSATLEFPYAIGCFHGTPLRPEGG